MDGFLRVAAATPGVQLADPRKNAKQIEEKIREASAAGASILVFPALSLCGASLGNLYGQTLLLQRCEEELANVIDRTESLDILCVVGLPLRRGGQVYNVLAAFQGGQLLALYGHGEDFILPIEFGLTGTPVDGVRSGLPAEAVAFRPAPLQPERISFAGFEGVPFGRNLLLTSEEAPSLRMALCFGDECLSREFFPPKSATLLLCAAAYSDGLYLRERRSTRLLAQTMGGAGLVLAGAGAGEAGSGCLYSGERLFVEDGVVLAKSSPYSAEGMCCADFDLERLSAVLVAQASNGSESALRIDFALPLSFPQTDFLRPVVRRPFLPQEQQAETTYEQLTTLLARGLAQRVRHIGAKKLFLGLSGGLDSTLALLLAVRAAAMGTLAKKDIVCISMPAFGTSQRTADNAEKLAECLGVSLRIIPLADVLRQHFRDIDMPEDERSTAYENAQARERTQVLMDIANRENGLVLGTGDLSEAALGWCTYNGDHMSMYHINASVPKTLVRALVAYEGTHGESEALRTVLQEILATPVSPELLPPGEGAQETESIIGPYELHDFYLYYTLRWGTAPAKLLRYASKAFSGVYDRETLLHWMGVFYQRFFSSQFKRNAMPDGPTIGAWSLSARGGWKMPSDAHASLWREEVESLRAPQDDVLK